MRSNRPHYKLDAWKEAMALVSAVYRATQGFPREEIYGLSSQLRRSAVSIPSNIAEGAARQGPKEFGQFLSVAMGSTGELETQLLIAVDLGYLPENAPAFDLVERVSKLVYGLQRRIRS
ncbi:MAG: four helix bundle protein [Betaproteobacteria bacterium]|nr:four helix bundle protein [Betaproteobacteria bacterium]